MNGILDEENFVLRFCDYLFRRIYIYIYIERERERDSPTLVGLSSLANEVIVLPLAFIASLFIYELRSR